MGRRRKGLQVVKRPGRQGYYVRGTTANGVFVFKAAGTHDETEARAFAVHLEAEILESGGPVESISFLRAAIEYLDFEERSRDQKRYVNKLVGHFGKKKIKDIGQAEIDKAAKRLYPDCTPETRNRQVYTPVVAILHFAEASYRGYSAPTIKRPKQKKRQPRPMRPEQAAAILEAAKDDHALYTFLLVLFNNGPRVTDATTLEWERTDLERRVFDIFESKTDTWRRCHMNEEVFLALANMPGERDGRIFPYRDRHDVYDALNETLGEKKGDFTPHRARHTFATQFLEQFNDPKLAMEAGGWQSWQAFSIYAHVWDSRVRDAAQQFSVSGANSEAKSAKKANKTNG